MLRVIALIIIAPLFLVLMITLVSFVINYQRSLPANNENTTNPTRPCGIAAATNIPTSGFIGSSISFSANISFSTCTENLTYEWVISDGNENLFLHGKNQNYIFKTPGKHHWEIKINEGSIVRYQTSGQIEINPAMPARLIAALFSGFGNSPNDQNGMTALLAEIESDAGARWNQNVFAAVFTYDNQRRNGSGDPACQKLSGNLDNPHRCALQWLSDLQPQPQDKLVFIGHSYGGNRARRMCFDVEAEPWNHHQQIAGLITIDAINWNTCSPIDIPELNTSSRTGQIDVECHSDCNQSRQAFDIPNTVVVKKSYQQTQGVYVDKPQKLLDAINQPIKYFSPCLQGYGNAAGDAIACSSETHDTIDDNPAIHREIRKFLTTLLTATPPIFSSTSSPCPTPRQLSTVGQAVRATPGKFTEISVTPYCQDGEIKIIVKPQIACDFYAVAGNLIWRPNSTGVIDATVSSDGMNKPLRIWVNANTSKPVAFDVSYIRPSGCH